MDTRELSCSRQTLLSIKDWDSFQRTLRILAKMMRTPGGAVASMR